VDLALAEEPAGIDTWKLTADLMERRQRAADHVMTAGAVGGVGVVERGPDSYLRSNSGSRSSTIPLKLFSLPRVDFRFFSTTLAHHYG
jgi:hypothetical protein